MDLIKIGRYIAGKRKDLGMTQRQLAEKLGMSDKSVSKWERGICLPDVSVYIELCSILKISINGFLAGEDIPQESIVQKSEENIIGVVADQKQKQKSLKIIIGGLLAVSILVLSVLGIEIYRKIKPQNFIVPVGQDSVEMETAELFFGPGGAYIYEFTTTDTYRYFRLRMAEYHEGELVNEENMELGFEGIGSPKNGEILIVSDFTSGVAKIILVGEGSKYAMEIPVLEGVEGREYYGRSATEIREATTIQYDEEQALMALIYDNDEIRVLDIYDLMDGRTDSLTENDYVYCFSVEFCKEQPP